MEAVGLIFGRSQEVEMILKPSIDWMNCNNPIQMCSPSMVSYETSAMMGPPSINEVSHSRAHTLTKERKKAQGGPQRKKVSINLCYETHLCYSYESNRWQR